MLQPEAVRHLAISSSGILLRSAQPTRFLSPLIQTSSESTVVPELIVVVTVSYLGV
jgi:hypothetical protein